MRYVLIAIVMLTGIGWPLIQFITTPSSKRTVGALMASIFAGLVGACLGIIVFMGTGLYRPGDLLSIFMVTTVAAGLASTIGSTVYKFWEKARAEKDARTGEAAKQAAATKQAERMALPRLFISYRREGDAGHAGRIADLLENEFGADHVFMDVDAIGLGVDFVKVINEEVAKCDVLLAVIGRNWLDARNEAGQRLLDAPVDFVRIEIAAALKRQIPVIPILVDGTKIPPADRLPEELKELERRNALNLRNDSFKADMTRLVRELKTESAFGNFMIGFLRGFTHG